MSAYAKGFEIIRLIQAQTEPITRDSDDLGMLVKKGDLNWNSVKQLVQQYGIASTRQVSGGYVSEGVELIEEGTGKKFRYRIEYTQIGIRKGGHRYDGFIHIYYLSR